MAHRLRNVLAVHLALVDPVRTLPDVGSMLSQTAFAHRAVEGRQLADRPKVPTAQNFARPGTHPPEPFQRKRREERGLAAGRHDTETVRLAEIGANLRAELVRRDADGHDQTAALSHRPLDLRGHG